MSVEKVSKTLVGDTPGRSTELNYFRIGPQDAARKVYLQAALHADEQPGIMVLHHLLPLPLHGLFFHRPVPPRYSGAVIPWVWTHPPAACR